MDPTSDRDMLDAALTELRSARAGAPSGARVLAFIERFTPVIQAHVARTMIASGRSRVHGQIRERMQEQVQLVWQKLFEHDARVLRLWDEGRGLSLAGWVGRFASLRTRDALRALAREPMTEQVVADRPVREASPEEQAAVAELWERVRAEIIADLSALGRQMFELLIEQDLTVEETRARHPDLSADAVLQWRSRLRKAVREKWDQFPNPPASGSRKPIE